jgi:hypothetical protein
MFYKKNRFFVVNTVRNTQLPSMDRMQSYITLKNVVYIEPRGIKKLINYSMRNEANVFVVDSTVTSNFRFLFPELNLTTPPSPSL